MVQLLVETPSLHLVVEQGCVLTPVSLAMRFVPMSANMGVSTGTVTSLATNRRATCAELVGADHNALVAIRVGEGIACDIAVGLANGTPVAKVRAPPTVATVSVGLTVSSAGSAYSQGGLGCYSPGLLRREAAERFFLRQGVVGRPHMPVVTIVAAVASVSVLVSDTGVRRYSAGTWKSRAHDSHE